MRIVAYADHKDHTPALLDTSWDELAQMLTDVERTECEPCPGKDCPHKYVGAWSPVDIRNGVRRNENVTAVTVAVFDLDHVDEATLGQVAEAIDGFEYVIHETHTAHCYRLVMPLSRDVAPKEWRTFLRTIIAEMKLPADPACKDLSRIYFLPTCPTSREPLVERGSGASLDVDAILAIASQKGVTTHALPDVEPEPEVEDDPVDLDSLRTALSRYRRRKAGSTNPADVERFAIIGRILKGEPLAQPGARDNTVNQAAALLAFILPASTPVEAMQELLRASLGAMNVEPEGLTHWQERAERSFTRASERRGERERERDAAQEKVRERLLARARERRHAAPDGEPKVVEDRDTDEPTEASPPDAENWKELLIPRADGGVKSCGTNVVTILRESPETRGTIRFNAVTKDIEVRGGPFDGVSSEVLDVTVTDWLFLKYGISMGAAEVGQRIMVVARANEYDPLADYLNGLVWDGVKRAHTLLTGYCSAVTHDEAGNDITAHVERVAARWLVSAVARALDPGCQVDTVLVLEGKQGARKTSALRVLGGAWFVETQLVLGDKDTEMLAGSSWVVELAELASLRRTETNAQKAWITKRKARIRLPYGRTLVELPRRCVLVGTVNPDDGGYLSDRTGNRRYWPVYVERVDIEALEKDRDQLWAEAVALFKAGEPWWLTEDEQVVADGLAEERLGESTIEDKVRRYWYNLHPSKRPAELSMLDVCEAALEVPVEKLGRGMATEVGFALRRLGFVKQRVRRQGSLTYVYKPTDEMRKAPQGGKPAHLRLIQGGDEGAGQEGNS